MEINGNELKSIEINEQAQVSQKGRGRIYHGGLRVRLPHWERHR